MVDLAGGRQGALGLVERHLRTVHVLPAGLDSHL